jgi:hypothetical protein
MPVVNENRTILKTASGAQLIVAERTTCRITASLIDETGAAIPANHFQALTLTLYARDAASQPIINSVNAVNVLNTGRGTVHATNGTLTLTLLPADNAIVDASADLEWHRALIQGTYETEKSVKYEVEFPVRNLNKVN